MAATIFKSSSVTDIEFGTPDITGLVVTSYSRARNASPVELKNGDGDVVAVAIPETIGELSIEGVTNGAANPTVGGILSISDIETSGTVIVNSVTESYTAENFKTVSISAREYNGTMTSA
jgi:altronate dehydratase